MNEINYITSAVLQALAEHPARLVKALEYACALTLVVAIATDSLLRRRRPVRQEKSTGSPDHRVIGARHRASTRE